MGFTRKMVEEQIIQEMKGGSSKKQAIEKLLKKVSKAAAHAEAEVTLAQDALVEAERKEAKLASAVSKDALAEVQARIKALNAIIKWEGRVASIESGRVGILKKMKDELE